MSQFDHESDNQSEVCNQLIRDFKLDEIPSIPRPTAADAALLVAMYERAEFQKRRDAYRGPDSKRHLQDELYRATSGAVAQYQQYLSVPPARRDPYGQPPYYVADTQEHFVRSLHAMVLQELDLYLEEREGKA